MSVDRSYVPPQAPVAVQHYRTLAQLWPPHWAQASVGANGIEQHYYRTGGDKPPLVLLHGIMAGGITWLRVAKALEAEFDLILVDARGHGHSARVGSAFSSELLVEDVAALIQTLGLERPALLGHSMGGVTAVLVAARYPNLVRAVISEDAVWNSQPGMAQAATASPHYQAWFNSYLHYLAALKTQSHDERLVAAFPYLPPGAAAWPEEEYVPWVEAQAQLDLDFVRTGMSLWTATQPALPMTTAVQQLAAPLLLLTGGRGNTDPQTVQAVAGAIRTGHHLAFEEAGHFLHLDQFERFMTSVREFLVETSSGSSG
jgi:N-formylmaleamate deformylase